MHTVLEHFMAQAVEGIVVIAPQTDVAAAVDSFRAPVPIILIAAREPNEVHAGAPGTGAASILPIAVDQRLGARVATEHLLDLGHRSVVHLAGPLDWFDARERAKGWNDALAARGVPEIDREMIRCSWSSDAGYEIGRDLARRVKDGNGPTAVFAGNDHLALGVLQAFWEAGVVVPRDVSVVGFDDVEGSAHFIPPAHDGPPALRRAGPAVHGAAARRVRRVHARAHARSRRTSWSGRARGPPSV